MIKDILSWLAHTAGLLVIMVVIGLISGSFAAGYAIGASAYFLKEALENGRNVYFWKWKFDSIMDFAFPTVVIGLALRYIGGM